MTAPEPGTGEQRPCSRGQWCASRTVTTEGGERVTTPAMGYQAFCRSDTALIAARLHPQHGLPAAYWWLRADLGNPVRRGEMVRVPFGPRMLLSEYYDLLMRRITEVLCSWEGRVLAIWEQRAREAGRSSARTPARTSSDAHENAKAAARYLSDNLSVLFAAPPEPMLRRVPSAELKAAESWRASSPVRALWQDALLHDNANGMAVIRPSLSGADAGTEILDLFSRCLSALGQIGPPAEVLDGVPCRVCGVMGLERAEPPSDPEREADWSRCPNLACGDRMDLKTYRQWTSRYEAWVKSLGPLTCRRCELAKGDPEKYSHQDCIYPGCECADRGHPRAA
jgi:hypothetical protein